MYVIGTPVSVVWPLGSTAKLVVQADLDVIVISAYGVSTYYVDPLTAFTAPTSTTNGTGTFTFTPEEHGEYLIKLVLGTSSSYTVVDEFDLPVRQSLPNKALSHDVRVLTTKARATWKPVEYEVLASTEWFEIYCITPHHNRDGVYAVLGTRFFGDKVGIAMFDTNTGQYETFTTLNSALVPGAVNNPTGFGSRVIQSVAGQDRYIVDSSGMFSSNNTWGFSLYLVSESDGFSTPVRVSEPSTAFSGCTQLGQSGNGNILCSRNRLSISLNQGDNFYEPLVTNRTGFPNTTVTSPQFIIGDTPETHNNIVHDGQNDSYVSEDGGITNTSIGNQIGPLSYSVFNMVFSDETYFYISSVYAGAPTNGYVVRAPKDNPTVWSVVDITGVPFIYDSGPEGRQQWYVELEGYYYRQAQLTTSLPYRSPTFPGDSSSWVLANTGYFGPNRQRFGENRNTYLKTSYGGFVTVVKTDGANTVNLFYTKLES